MGAQPCEAGQGLPEEREVDCRGVSRYAPTFRESYLVDYKSEPLEITR
jgi:hypothetical protein